MSFVCRVTANKLPPCIQFSHYSELLRTPATTPKTSDNSPSKEARSNDFPYMTMPTTVRIDPTGIGNYIFANATFSVFSCTRRKPNFTFTEQDMVLKRSFSTATPSSISSQNYFFNCSNDTVGCNASLSNSDT